MIVGNSGGGGDTADVAAEASKWAVDDASVMAALEEKEKTIAASFEAELTRCKDVVAGGISQGGGSLFMTEDP